MSEAKVMRTAIRIATFAVFFAGWTATCPADEKPADVFQAAQKGDMAALTALLDGSPDLVRSRNKLEQTPLHAAVLGREPAPAVEMLLNRGAEVNATDRRLDTPLHVAAKALSVPAAEILLAHKADVDARNERGESPLHGVAYGGQDRAADDEQREILGKLLLRAKATVDAADNDGMTPLHVAAVRGRDRLLAVLLEANAGVGIADAKGRTPLHMAALGNHKKIIGTLIEKKADVKAADKEGNTPLHTAASRFREDAMEVLLANGADVNTRNAAGATPLIVLANAPKGDRAIDAALVRVAERLLAQGADAAVKDQQGNTAAYYARQNGHEQLAALLGGA